MKNIGLIIRKYTDSILDCLKEEKSRVIEELNNLKIAFEEDTSLGKYINSQLLNKSQKIEIIDSISEKLKLHQFTKNFLVLLIKNDKFSLFVQIVNNVNKEDEKSKNIYNGIITLAYPISEEEINIIKDVIEKKLKSQINLEIRFDESILGGMIVSVENYVLDLSYKNILSEIKVKSVKMLADL